MSRVYQALKRVELERDLARRGETFAAPPKPDARAWWQAAACGFAVGLVVATVGWAVTLRLRAPAPPDLRPAQAPAAERTSAPVVAATAATADAGPASVPARSDPPADAPRVEDAPPRGPIALQAGSFRDERNADRLAATLRARGYPVQVEAAGGEPPTWTVRVGGWRDRSAVSATRAELARDGLETFVVVRGAR